MGQLQTAGGAHLLRRFEQSVHEPAQIAAGDVAASGRVGLDAERLGRFDVELRHDLGLVLEVAGGDGGVQFRHAEVHGTGERGGAAASSNTANRQPHANPFLKDRDR